MLYRESAALAAAANFTRQEVFKQSEHIACYLHYRDEFDSLPIMEAIWQANKQCYLPILTEENSLRFVRYKKGDALQENRYSIFEPVNITNECPPQNLNIVITPLFAFDLQGHRLGTGGGYYDRTFAFLHHSAIKRPLMIGLGYSMQQENSLPFDDWDIGLNGIITEKEFILIEKQ